MKRGWPLEGFADSAGRGRRVGVILAFTHLMHYKDNMKHLHLLKRLNDYRYCLFLSQLSEACPIRWRFTLMVVNILQ